MGNMLEQISGFAKYTETVNQQIEKSSLAGRNWQAKGEYKKGDTSIYECTLYVCLADHKAGNDFQSDFKKGYWVEGINNLEISNENGYMQLTKLNVTASQEDPAIISLPINKTKTFCLPPIDVLKSEGDSPTKVLTTCSFDDSDADDFVFDSDNVEFSDGTMHQQTRHKILQETTWDVSAASAYNETGSITVSDKVDPSDYKEIVSLKNFNTGLNLTVPFICHLDDNFDNEAGNAEFTVTGNYNFLSVDSPYFVRCCRVWQTTKLEIDRPGPTSFGTGSFTIDWWVYPWNLSQNFALWNSRYNVICPIRIKTAKNTGSSLYDSLQVMLHSEQANTWDANYTTTARLKLNKWNHCALMRNVSSQQIIVAINGKTESFSYSSTKSLAATQPNVKFGLRPDGEYNTLPGYYRDFRIIKGQCAWTEYFTPDDMPYGWGSKLYIKDNGEVWGMGA